MNELHLFAGAGGGILGGVQPTLFDTDVETNERYPDSPGFKRTGTSKEAAASVKPCRSEAHRQIRNVLEYRPMTADEIAAALDWSILFCRPRCSELKLLGKIRATGQRRKNQSGKWAEVLEVV